MVKVYDQKDGLTLNRVLDYIQADREASYKSVCAHCRAKVPYDPYKRRHIRVKGVKITCHAQHLRDRPEPREFLDNLHLQENYIDRFDFKQIYQLPAHKSALLAQAYGMGADKIGKLDPSYVHHAMSSNVDPKVCDACQGATKINGETCWHCEGEGIDPTK